MKHCIICRNNYGVHSTIGALALSDGMKVLLSCVTCELPWDHNNHGTSCIPSGNYVCSMYNSPKHGMVPLVENVPHRDMIEIHPANFSHELLGCIAPGMNAADIDNDGTMDVANSKVAFGKLMAALGGDQKFNLTILGNGTDELS